MCIRDSTFRVQVLDKIPSTNTSAHTFKRAKVGAVKRGSVRGGGSFTHSFQSFASNGLKAKRDRAYDHALEIKKVGHAKYSASGAAYNAATGVLTLTVANNPCANGDHVRIADNSLVMTCDMDNNATNHSYPRETDPASGKWLEVSGVSGNNFNVNVGTTPRANYLVSAADYTPTTGDMVLTIGSHNYNGGSSHTVTGANYNPTTGVMTVTVADHGFVIGDRVKFDDNSITFRCQEDSLGSDHSYPRASDPVSDRWLDISNITTDTFDVTVLDSTPSNNTTAHVFQSAVANGLKVAHEAVYIENQSLVFKCQADNFGSCLLYTSPSPRD